MNAGSDEWLDGYPHLLGAAIFTYCRLAMSGIELFFPLLNPLTL